MEVSVIFFLVISLIALIIGFVICLLSLLGYNTYVRFYGKKKKIEVALEKTNSNPGKHE